MKSRYYSVKSVGLLPRQKGANGRPICIECEVHECAGKRRTFCSDECQLSWRLKNSGTEIRRQSWKRDLGVCKQCGVDCGWLDRIRHLAVLGKPGMAREVHKRWRAIWQVRIVQYDIPKKLQLPGMTLWFADHNNPVFRGGGQCGLDNIQTLCWKCHAEKTRDESRQRARMPRKRRGKARI